MGLVEKSISLDIASLRLSRRSGLAQGALGFLGQPEPDAQTVGRVGECWRVVAQRRHRPPVPAAVDAGYGS